MLPEDRMVRKLGLSKPLDADGRLHGKPQLPLRRDAFRGWLTFVTFVGDLDDIFCIEAERVVSAHRRRRSPKRQAESENQPRKFTPRQSLGTAWTRSTWPCRLQEQQKPSGHL